MPHARSSRATIARRVALGAGLALALPLLALLGVAGWFWANTDVPPPGSVQNPQASVIRFADGSELGRLSEQNRTSVPLNQVSLAARQAVLAAEDRGFYEGGGISTTGILRAFWTNLRSGEVRQGGSTITQQYARNAYLTSERTWTRKAREAVLAIKLDHSTTKLQILERYLNTVYFGRGAYGIEAAAQTFFAKPAAELTAGEGAVLASLLRSPSAYDPARNPELARERWRYTLDGMAGQGWLDGPVEAIEYPQVVPEQSGSTFGGPNGYLLQQALTELEALGYSEAEIRVAGLVVDTTFDPRAQAEAVRAVHEVTGPTAPAGVYRALVSVEPGTGRVKASYSGRDYLERPFDAVTQGSAQAGSSFKPYVLAAALAEGIALRTLFDGSSPQRFGDYEVKNYGDGDGQDFGQIDLVEATRSSVNTVYVPLGLQAGLGNVADTAAALGVTSDMSIERAGASLSLGVTAVTPLDQANAYATLAAGGVRATPYVVERITDGDGRVVHQTQPVTERVIDEAVAADVTFALQQVVQDGTGQAAGLPARPVAGKTGTTTGNTAAWFVGYTPRLATAVALYTDRSDTSLPAIAGVRSVTGGSLPAR
ncbi:MAG: transglycosylase domain-containing protein, partial [Actinobacteria bacterium]|nr:transglycosylase domain-containing protein [Actinomycetota bacterium]